MKLDDLSRFDTDLQRTKMLYGIITLCAVLTLPAMYYLNLKQMERISSTPVVVGPDYRMFEATRRSLTLDERRLQYEDHARVFWQELWTQDKSTIKRNVGLALKKSDESGEQVYKEYFIEKGLERNILESNWASELEVLESRVRIDTVPYQGIVYGRWKVTRPGGSSVRHLDFTFSIKEHGVGPENRYGALVKDINIFDNTKFDEKN